LRSNVWHIGEYCRSPSSEEEGDDDDGEETAVARTSMHAVAVDARRTEQSHLATADDMQLVLNINRRVDFIGNCCN